MGTSIAIGVAGGLALLSLVAIFDRFYRLQGEGSPRALPLPVTAITLAVVIAFLARFAHAGTIELPEKLRWSWREARQGARQLTGGLAFTAICALLTALVTFVYQFTPDVWVWFVGSAFVAFLVVASRPVWLSLRVPFSSRHAFAASGFSLVPCVVLALPPPLPQLSLTLSMGLPFAPPPTAIGTFALDVMWLGSPLALVAGVLGGLIFGLMEARRRRIILALAAISTFSVAFGITCTELWRLVGLSPGSTVTALVFCTAVGALTASLVLSTDWLRRRDTGSVQGRPPGQVPARVWYLGVGLGLLAGLRVVFELEPVVVEVATTSTLVGAVAGAIVWRWFFRPSRVKSDRTGEVSRRARMSSSAFGLLLLGALSGYAVLFLVAPLSVYTASPPSLDWALFVYGPVGAAGAGLTSFALGGLRSARRPLTMGLVGGVLTATTAFLFGGVYLGAELASLGRSIGGSVHGALYATLPIALAAGLLGGLARSLDAGGRACFQQLLLRGLLIRSRLTPPRYVRFLERAVDLGLLRRLDGGYTFTHRLVLERLADTSPGRTSDGDR
jgi:hypothetical protein